MQQYVEQLDEFTICAFYPYVKLLKITANIGSYFKKIETVTNFWDAARLYSEHFFFFK